eukprot:SM000243S08589  [mRNA]  locus=s243:59944:60876:- [translate_table: standard]
MEDLAAALDGAAGLAAARDAVAQAKLVVEVEVEAREPAGRRGSSDGDVALLAAALAVAVRALAAKAEEARDLRRQLGQADERAAGAAGGQQERERQLEAALADCRASLAQREEELGTSRVAEEQSRGQLRALEWALEAKAWSMASLQARADKAEAEARRLGQHAKDLESAVDALQVEVVEAAGRQRTLVDAEERLARQLGQLEAEGQEMARHYREEVQRLRALSGDKTGAHPVAMNSEPAAGRRRVKDTRRLPSDSQAMPLRPPILAAV